MVSIVSAYFTIYAYAALQDKLDSIEHLRFLFGEPRFVTGLDPSKTDKRAYRLEDHGLQLANRLEQSATARACAAWMSSTRRFTMIRKGSRLAPDTRSCTLTLSRRPLQSKLMKSGFEVRGVSPSRSR